MNEKDLKRALSKQFKECSSLFVALGDETRQQILSALYANAAEGLRVPQITELTHLSRPAVSHHLKILKDAGFVRMRREGTRNYYYGDPESRCWRDLKALLDNIQAVRAVCRCCAQGESKTQGGH